MGSNDTSRIVTKKKKERKFLNTKAEKRFLLLQLNIDFVCFLYYHYYTIFCKTRISVGKRARFLEVVRQITTTLLHHLLKKKFEKIRIVLREKKENHFEKAPRKNPTTAFERKKNRPFRF